MILDITYTNPERYVPPRWFSIYNVSMNLDRLWDALVIIYCSYIRATQKRSFLSSYGDIHSPSS